MLNGTSTSNKVALGALVTDGDLVLFDRNNHKAAHHGALMINGGIPIYVPTMRNAWGLIGPMRWDVLDEKALRERDPQPSAGHGQGRLAQGAAVPRRRGRAVHL